NGTIILPGARLGRRVFTGEGALIPAGAVIPDDSVVVGSPARKVRSANDDDMKRLLVLRGGDLSVPSSDPRPVSGRSAAGAAMGTTYEYRGTWPKVDDSAVVFDSAELTGDVHVGARTII